MEHLQVKLILITIHLLRWSQSYARLTANKFKIYNL